MEEMARGEKRSFDEEWLKHAIGKDVDFFKKIISQANEVDAINKNVKKCEDFWEDNAEAAEYLNKIRNAAEDRIKEINKASEIKLQAVEEIEENEKGVKQEKTFFDKLKKIEMPEDAQVVTADQDAPDVADPLPAESENSRRGIQTHKIIENVRGLLPELINGGDGYAGISGVIRDNADVIDKFDGRPEIQAQFIKFFNNPKDIVNIRRLLGENFLADQEISTFISRKTGISTISFNKDFDLNIFNSGSISVDGPGYTNWHWGKNKAIDLSEETLREALEFINEKVSLLKNLSAGNNEARRLPVTVLGEKAEEAVESSNTEPEPEARSDEFMGTPKNQT